MLKIFTDVGLISARDEVDATGIHAPVSSVCKLLVTDKWRLKVLVGWELKETTGPSSRARRKSFINRVMLAMLGCS